MFIDGMRDGPPPFNGGFCELRPLPQALIEERLADQYHEIQGLLHDNQGLVATHVALNQELAAVHHELQRVSEFCHPGTVSEFSPIAVASAEMFFDRMRDGPPPFNGGFCELRPLQQALIEERLADQYHEIQGLLLDNQWLVATHVALNQELAAVHHELQRASFAAGSLQVERDSDLWKIYDNSMKMEAELRAAETMRAELIQVQGEKEKLNAARQDLTAQVQMLTEDMARASAELQRAPAIKAEIEAMKQEVQRARDAIEYEKKGCAENYELGQLIEKNLILMAHEIEKLRPEVANAEKRARAAADAGNQGFVGNYRNLDSSYRGNTYPSGYGMSPVPGGVVTGAQYAASSGPGHGSWSAYEMQGAYGQR